MANPEIKPVTGGEIATGAANKSQPSPTKGRLGARMVTARDEKKETGGGTSAGESKPAAFQDFRRRGLLQRMNTGAVDEFETQPAPKSSIERSRLQREKKEHQHIEVRKIDVTRMKKSSDEESQ